MYTCDPLRCTPTGERLRTTAHTLGGEGRARAYYILQYYIMGFPKGSPYKIGRPSREGHAPAWPPTSLPRTRRCASLPRDHPPPFRIASFPGGPRSRVAAYPHPPPVDAQERVPPAWPPIPAALPTGGPRSCVAAYLPPASLPPPLPRPSLVPSRVPPSSPPATRPQSNNQTIKQSKNNENTPLSPERVIWYNTQSLTGRIVFNVHY